MTERNIFYQVALQVDSDVYPEFKTWLDAHIQEMLALPGFLSHQILSCYDISDNRVDLNRQTTTQVTAVYQLESLEKLEEYFQVHAPAMRGDGIKKFGGKFTASRKVFYRD